MKRNKQFPCSHTQNFVSYSLKLVDQLIQVGCDEEFESQSLSDSKFKLQNQMVSVANAIEDLKQSLINSTSTTTSTKPSTTTTTTFTTTTTTFTNEKEIEKELEQEWKKKKASKRKRELESSLQSLQNTRAKANQIKEAPEKSQQIKNVQKRKKKLCKEPQDTTYTSSCDNSDKGVHKRNKSVAVTAPKTTHFALDDTILPDPTASDVEGDLLISRRTKIYIYQPLKYYKGEIPIFCTDKVKGEQVLLKFHIVPTPATKTKSYKTKTEQDTSESPTKFKSTEEEKKGQQSN